MAGEGSIRFFCPGCNWPLKVEREKAGVVGFCKHCGASLRVPEQSTRHAGDRRPLRIGGDTLVVERVSEPPQVVSLEQRVEGLERAVQLLQGPTPGAPQPA